MLTRESTLIHIDRYNDRFNSSPTIDDLMNYVPNRLQRHLADRVDALVRGGHVTIDETGRITRTTGTTPTETL